MRQAVLAIFDEKICERDARRREAVGLGLRGRGKTHVDLDRDQFVFLGMVDRVLKFAVFSHFNRQRSHRISLS